LNNAINLIIQIDSLTKLDAEEWNGSTVIIDELHSLLSYLHTSDTLNTKRREVYEKFLYIIKNAKYLICLDSDLNCSDIRLVAHIRKMNDEYINNSPILMYINHHKCYNGKNAYFYKYKDHLFGKLFDTIYNKKKFPIVGFDSKKESELCYNRVIQRAIYLGLDVEYFKNNSKLYTAQQGDKQDFKDVSKSWNNHAIFFSPCVVYGVDYNPTKSQPVFVFSTKKNFQLTLDSLQLTQQSNRNRKISEVHYYIESGPRQCYFRNTTDVKQYYSQLIGDFVKFVLSDDEEDKDIDKNILRVLTECQQIDYVVGESQSLKENIFTNTLFDIEHTNDILRSNVHYHFAEALRNKGFAIVYKNQNENIEYDEQDAQEIKIEVNNADELRKSEHGEMVYSVLKSIKNDDDVINPDHMHFKEQVKKRLDFLNLTAKDILKPLVTFDDMITNGFYLDIIGNDFYFNEHMLTCGFYLTTESLQTKLKEKRKDEFIVNLTQSDKNKILALKKLESSVGIEPFQSEIDDKNASLELDPTLWENFKKVFRIRSDKLPETMEDIHLAIMKQYPKTLVKISVSGRERKSENRGKYKHTIEIKDVLLEQHFKLFQKRNPELLGINGRIKFVPEAVGCLL